VDNCRLRVDNRAVYPGLMMSGRALVRCVHPSVPSFTYDYPPRVRPLVRLALPGEKKVAMNVTHHAYDNDD
jgi:hypothetical protein